MRLFDLIQKQYEKLNERYDVMSSELEDLDDGDKESKFEREMDGNLAIRRYLTSWMADILNEKKE